MTHPEYQHISPFYVLGDVFRFGFNGKELDTEGMGGGSSTYDYGFRIYNAALGKFLSVDPLYNKFAMMTPYQYASNTPIYAIDLEGLEALAAINHYTTNSGSVILRVIPDDEIVDNATCDFQFRVMANALPGGNTEEIYTKDELGNMDFGYTEIQAALGGMTVIQGRAYDRNNNPLDNIGGDSFTGVGNSFKDFVVPVDITNGPSRNQLISVNIPSVNSWSYPTASLLGTTGTQSIIVPPTPASTRSTSNVQYSIQINAFTEPNAVTIRDITGNIMSDNSGSLMMDVGSGVMNFNFSLPPGTGFSVQVSGDSSFNDSYSVNVSETTTTRGTAVANP